MYILQIPKSKKMLFELFISFQWMPYEEYATQPFVQKHELLRYIADVCRTKKDGGYSGFSAVPTVTSFSKKKSFLYVNRQDVDS